MKVWFTAAELADAAVEGLMPDLPRTVRGVQLRAQNEGWASFSGLARPRTGREGGGGLEYHIDILPTHVRLAYASKFVAMVPAVPPGLPSIPEGNTLSAAGRRTRDARLAILTAADRYKAGNRLSVMASDGLFAGLYNAGMVELAPWVRPIVKSLSTRTLARWRSQARGAGTEALGYDPALSRKDTGVLARAAGGAVKTFILALLAKNQFLSAEHVRNTVAAEFPALTLPSLRAFQAQIGRWRKEYRNELMRVADPDGYRSRIEFVATGTSRATRLNEVWQIDASPLDAIMLSGKRQTIYAAIDVFSRRAIILVTETPRAAAVGLLLRKAILSWGVPERIKTDNGSDFTAHATGRLLAGLGIETELAPPYTPRAKAIVERVIGTFQRDFAATLPGFIGHSVADRKIIENRKAFSRRLGLDDAHLFDADMTEPEAQAYADAWAGEIYAHTAHDGLGGRTPFAVAASYAGEVRRIGNVAALDLLLAPVAGQDGRRRVTKTGILVAGSHYLIGSVMPGVEVFCRMDPADLGRLHVFAADGETFLGHAVCPLLAGLDPVHVAAKVKAEQKRFLEERTKPIRAQMRRIGPRQVADAQLAAARARSGNLIPFTRAAAAHQTPALEAAGRAAARNAEAAPLSGRAAALHEEIKRTAGDSPAAVLQVRSNVRTLKPAESREQRFRRALDIEAQVTAGAEIPAADLIWLGGYREGPEYRAMQRMRSEFGDALRL